MWHFFLPVSHSAALKQQLPPAQPLQQLFTFFTLPKPPVLLLLAQGSDAAVVRATGSQGCCCSPLHGEEGDCSKKSHQHHDQELPLQQEIVAVEIGNCSTDGLRGKTKGKDYQRFPGWCCYRRIIKVAQRQFNMKLSEWFCSRQRILRLHYTSTYVSACPTTDLVVTCYLNSIQLQKMITKLQSVCSIASWYFKW